jgi:hypothetical protein
MDEIHQISLYSNVSWRLSFKISIEGPSWFLLYGFTNDICWFGLVLWFSMPLSTIFQLFRGGQFYLWGETEKTRPVESHLQTLSHNVVLRKYPP